MTPRRASLRVAHQASCPNATKSSIDSLKGCKCRPSYYVFNRRPDGTVEKSARVKDRQVAERALRKVQVAIDEGRVGLSRPTHKTFGEWADEYLEIIGKHGRKGSTVAAYTTTLEAYARPAFGTTPLRQVGNPELRKMVEAIREKGGSDATVAKHLRHVGAIFQGAVDDSLIAANPVPKFKKSLRLRISGGVEPFTDLELARLWASLDALKAEAVYVAFLKTAAVTGARVGELAALNLGDVDLLAGTVRIERHYDRDSGTFTLPKDGEARTLNLIRPARTLLEEWIKLHGDRDDTAPLFPAPRGDRINTQYLRKLVTDGMAKAKPPIPKTGEGGRPRKPLHSLRATFDRICLERGLHPQWVQAQLGHSSAELTLQAYGQWTDAAKRAEADKLEAEGVPV
ncbi:MAG TPA: tyrosine-type recombinase/integrase [Gaiellaceae bacterium]|jgi:integrase